MTSDNDTAGVGAAPTPLATAAAVTALAAQNTLLHHRLLELDSRLDDLAESFDVLEETLTATARTMSTDTTGADPSTETRTEDGQTSSAAADTTAPQDTSAAQERNTEPDIRVLLPWVRCTIAERCERKLPQGQGRIRWCRSWWRHREALARFAALYRAWVEATDPETGTGTALVAYYEHLDHALEVLMSDHGPFSAGA
ncbi:DUF4913 domain-containing protein [Pseudonocardia sp. ICBG601]|uniref:DUF4913 domain-containing protein n=2 Tax=Pseudonocardia sp. ICBG601 TaxID=2846759 RepID=UPI001CF651B1|nr:DUF4913 domain-containing protein [Pseudonocardia sp. ICBG601]